MGYLLFISPGYVKRVYSKSPVRVELAYSKYAKRRGREVGNVVSWPKQVMCFCSLPLTFVCGMVCIYSHFLLFSTCRRVFFLACRRTMTTTDGFDTRWVVGWRLWEGTSTTSPSCFLEPPLPDRLICCKSTRCSACCSFVRCDTDHNGQVPQATCILL